MNIARAKEAFTIKVLKPEETDVDRVTAGIRSVGLAFVIGGAAIAVTGIIRRDPDLFETGSKTAQSMLPVAFIPEPRPK